MRGVQHRLREKVWDGQQQYYETAARSSQVETFGMRRAACRLLECRLLLDCGCGEGTKGESVAGPGTLIVGLDLAQRGLRLAHERGSPMVPIQGDLTRIPFRSGSFDAVFCADTFEHLADPDAALAECIRVTRRGGLIAITAPNYGSPLFPSPCSVENRASRFARRVRFSLSRASAKRLSWDHVQPRALEEAWQPDYDAVVEPFLPTLRRVLTSSGCRVLESGTGWVVRRSVWSPKGLIRLLGKCICASGIPLIRDWGPNMYVIARRER